MLICYIKNKIISQTAC